MSDQPNTKDSFESLRQKARENRFPELYGISKVSRQQRIEDLKKSVEERYN